MKVMVFGADSFLGINIINRFHKEGHSLVGVYQNKHIAEKPSAPHLKYTCSDIDSIKSVFIYERPEIVIYAKTEVTDNVPESRKKVAEVSELSRLSSEYQALKFIYISSTNVYSAKDSTDENDMPHPQTLDAKTNLLCENSLVAYRTDKDLFNVVLRMSDICGEYEYSNAPSVLSRMIAEAIKIGTITTGLNREHALLYVGDAVDAVYRSISDNVDGIYNISPKTAISGPVLAETIYSECQCENPIVGSTFEIQHIVLPPSEKARNEIGFIELSDTQKLVQKTIEWYKTEKVKPKKASGKKRKFPAILTFVESAVVFALLAWLEFILGDASVLNSINLLFLYIIFASVYGGISHGIFAAILVSLYNIFESVLMGFSFSSVAYSFEMMISVVVNLAIALIIGYVIERKDTVINELKTQLDIVEKENVYVKQLNTELGNIKIDQEYKLLKYEDGLGKLYSAIARLNSLSPNEVFLNSLKMISELTDENDIALYLVQKSSGYLRLFTYMGKKPSKISSAFRYDDSEQYRNIVTKKHFYANRFMEPEMPAIIMPIIVNDQTVALIVIEDFAFEKLNLFYLNVLKIAGNLLSDFYSKTQIYDEIAKQFACEKGTSIMVVQSFAHSVTVAMSASKETSFSFCLLRITDSEYKSDAILSENVRHCVRAVDEIGRLPDKSIGILLYATNRENSNIVCERLARRGIKTETISVG